MKVYRSDRPCVKCGGTNLVTEYEVGTDLMSRICQRCEYTWHELPLDRDREKVSAVPHPNIPGAGRGRSHEG